MFLEDFECFTTWILFDLSYGILFLVLEDFYDFWRLRDFVFLDLRNLVGDWGRLDLLDSVISISASGIGV